MPLTARESATVLHALRMFQEAYYPKPELSGFSCGLLGFACDHFATADPLEAEEIDELCERLNCGEIRPDKCQVCHGDKGGVRGNENIVDGVVMCDYCTVAYTKRTR